MWLLPSRARPASLARFFDAYRRTGGSTPGMVIIDCADLEAQRAAYDALELPPGWFIRPTGGAKQGDKIREVWGEVEDCAWLGLIGDDCVPQTHRWDALLVERLDGDNIVSCDDGWQAPGRLGNCWIIAGELARAVGYIFPPGLQHLFVDDVWEVIGREAACWACRMEVRVEHRHVLKGAAAADDTHRAAYSSERWNEDGEVFRAWLAGDRHRAVAAAQALRSTSNCITGRGDKPAEMDPESAARMARARSRSVMILTPIARAPCWQYALALAETCVMLEQLGIRYAMRFVIGSSNLPRARNELAARFLASGFSDAVFIDDDMGWQANAALRLIASEQKVIAAVGRKKVDKPLNDPAIWCAHFGAGAGEALEQDAMGAVQVERAGTGMMKISREVFEQMIAAHPEWKRPGTPDMATDVRAHYYQFFKFDDETEMGEDYTFCERWKALGGEVWIDPKIALSHVGEKAWEGCIAEIMQPAAAP